MSESSKLPISLGNKPPRFRDKRHAKILLAIIGFEAVAIVALVIWFVATKPATTPTTPPTAQTTPETADTPPPTLGFRQVATGFQDVTGITALRDTSDKRLFVLEQAGLVRIIQADGSVAATPFLDLTKKALMGGETGLLGLAFHPKALTNHYFFVNYVDKQLNTVVARYSISPQTGLADAKSEKVLLKIKQPYTNHKGGDLAFGPDGYLYLTLGDGGGAGDPENRAQNKGEFLGKILRIDVDSGDPYAVPATNPFAKVSGVKPEIWALGLRNAWRMSFDRSTGDLYIADVGQGDYEEINFQPKTSTGGHNYGWRCYEGTTAFNTSGCEPANAFTPPIAVHDHAQNRCSITGGYVYRGSTYPSMAGHYFYGDFCSGQFFYLQVKDGKASQPVLAATTDYAISTFGQDSRGELFVADRTTGIIYQLQDTAKTTQ